MNRLILLCLLAVLPVLLPAEEMFSVDKNGILSIGKDCRLTFNVNYRAGQNSSALFTQNPYFLYKPEITKDDALTTVRSVLEKENLPDSEIIYRRISDLEWEASYRLNYPADFKLNFAALELEMPIVRMVGKTVEYKGRNYVFPEAVDKKRGYAFGVFENVSEFRLPLANGTLTLAFQEPCKKFMLNDNRFFDPGIKNYSCRIMMNSKNRESRISLKMTYTPNEVRSIPLGSAANRTFSDRVAGDGKGGWTDQGPEQDLSPLAPGLLEVAPAKFQIASDRDGNSCIVLSGGAVQSLPKVAELPMDGKPVGTLFLLHALAWAPQGKVGIGELVVEYTDGTQSRFPVTNEKDVANWWGPSRSFENAQLAWKDKIMNMGELRDVGLFLSVFHPDAQKKVKSLQFRSNGGSVWMIAAVSASDQPVQLAANTSTEFELKRSGVWRPYRPCLRVEPGSALDFSFLQDAPAGKYGRVTAGEDGKFHFQKSPDKTFHIWGTNLCFDSTQLDKADAEKLVENLKAFGYNAVRFHHFDMILCGWGNQTAEINPKQLDRLFYTISLLKKAGIYYSLDLYTARTFDIRKVPGVTWDPKKVYYDNVWKDRYNLAAMLLKPVRDDLKQFTRNLLEPVNPYTGVAIKDDPALISISILNENSMLVSVSHPLSIEKEQYVKAFEQQAKERKLTLTETNYGPEFRKFAMEVYRDYFNDMKNFLRNEIRTKAMITDQNFVGYPNLTFQRLDYDFTDEHIYCGTNSLQSRFAFLNGAARRVFGKPFQISEFNFGYQAPNRSEGGLIYPAMAALQDWDGLYRFCHANRQDIIFSPGTGLELFDMVNDPVRNIPERIAGMIFLRRDVAPAAESVVTAVGYGSSLEPFMRAYPTNTNAVVFSAKVGSAAVSPDGKSFLNPIPKKTTGIVDISTEYKPNGGIPVLKGSDDEAMAAFAGKHGYARHAVEDKVTSSTGEIKVDFPKSIFHLSTPRTEGFYFDRQGDAAGDILSVKTDSPATVAATSLDGKNLPDSARVLLIHVTDMQNEGTVYTDQTRRTILKEVIHQRPVTILFRNAQAEITFKTNLANPVLYALDCSGKRIGKVDFTRNGKDIAFRAITDRNGTACFAYELCN